MTTKADIEKEVIKLKSVGLGNRMIARELFGKSSMESTVRGILKRAKFSEGMKWGDGNEIGLKNLKNAAEEYKDSKNVLSYDNSRILIISDLHIPYHHQDALEFLGYLKDKYQPTRIICMGDELDKAALSYHESDPDLPSAGDELRKSLPIIKQLKEMFPIMDILESNHGSLVYRKAKTAGIPRHYIKSYGDILGVSDEWKWHFDLTITLPNNQKCYFHHGKISEGARLSQSMGMNCVQGHFHEKFKIDYWGNPVGLFWSLQVGCFVNDKSLAMSYNNANLKRPIIGTGLIINSHPVLEPMILDTSGRWVGHKTL